MQTFRGTERHVVLRAACKTREWTAGGGGIGDRTRGNDVALRRRKRFISKETRHKSMKKRKT